jgi:hypothetical protein
MGYARIRPDLGLTWSSPEIQLRDLEGNELYWKPEQEWVESAGFDVMGSGLYVLTEEGDYYFTCHSSDLEYADTIPTKPKETKMGKHALPYNVHRDIEGAENAFIEHLGQDLDTWQLIARDLARDIMRGKYLAPDTKSFASDILNRLSHLPEMGIHPSEVTR